jgi:hypothetical protein
MNDRQAIRRTYLAFRAGAQLRLEDADRLLRTKGIELTNNRLRELARDSDRGASITAVELHALVSAWAQEMKEARTVIFSAAPNHQED